jgi:cation diffusion facilitator family transporter
MHHVSLEHWSHDHSRLISDRSSGEKKTVTVVIIAAAMMVIEIAAGPMLNSMALFADGWHMATHVAAFVIAALAYRFARTHADDRRFAFGTGKIEVLGGFVSALVLAGIAVLMAVGSLERILTPQPIHFDEAILIAGVGLVVNLVCAWVLKDAPDHHHGHGHSHPHVHGQDLNQRSAYLHVLADAFTSVTAVTALTLGKFLNWVWLDPVIGLLGVTVILSWAYSLLRDTGAILLDVTPASTDLPAVIREGIEDEDARICDLHVWQVGSGKFAAVVSVVADHPKPPLYYREILKQHEELVHVTVEVHQCEES